MVKKLTAKEDVSVHGAAACVIVESGTKIACYDWAASYSTNMGCVQKKLRVSLQISSMKSFVDRSRSKLAVGQTTSCACHLERILNRYRVISKLKVLRKFCEVYLGLVERLPWLRKLMKIG
jgi:hypothetical protein